MDEFNNGTLGNFSDLAFRGPLPGYALVDPLFGQYVQDLLWRRHAYNNAILSMRKLFREETEQKKSFGVGFDRVKKDEREELEGRLEINNQRNRQYAEER